MLGMFNRKKIKFKKNYVRVLPEMEFEEILNLINESDNPLIIKLKTKDYIKSIDLGILLSISNIHKEKFDSKLKLIELSESQINIFNSLNINSVIDY